MRQDEFDILGKASVDFGLPVSTNLVQNNGDMTGSGYKRRLTWCEDWAEKGAQMQGQVMVKWQGALQSFRSNLNPFANVRSVATHPPPLSLRSVPLFRPAPSDPSLVALSAAPTYPLLAQNAAFREVRQLDRPEMIAELRKPEVRHKILEEASEGPLVLSVRTTNSLPPFLPSSLPPFLPSSLPFFTSPLSSVFSAFSEV